jgi:hypothetical protein
MSTIQQTEHRWMNRQRVAEALDVPAGSVPALAAKGLIRTRDLPGIRAIYSAEDVARLARQAGAAAG